MSGYAYSQPYTNGYAYAQPQPQPQPGPPPPPPLPQRPPRLGADPTAALTQQFGGLGISPPTPQPQPAPHSQYQQQVHPPANTWQQVPAQQPSRPAYQQQQQAYPAQQYAQQPYAAPPPQIYHPAPSPQPPAQPSYSTYPQHSQAPVLAHPPPSPQPAAQPPPPPAQPAYQQYHHQAQPASAAYQPPPSPSPQYLSPRPQYLPGAVPPATQFLAPASPHPQPVASAAPAPAAPYHPPPAQQFLALAPTSPAPTSPPPPSGYAATQYGAPAPQYHAPSPQHLLASSPAASPLLTAATPAPVPYQAPSTPYRAPATPTPAVQYQAPPAQYQAQAQSPPSQQYASPPSHQYASPPSQSYSSPPSQQFLAPSQPYASPPTQQYSSPPSSQQYASPPAQHQSPPAHATYAPARQPSPQQPQPAPASSDPYAAMAAAFPPGWTFTASPSAQSSSNAAGPPSLQQVTAAPATNTNLPNLEADPLPPQPLIQAEGPPPRILPMCPGNRELLFDMTFYHLPAHADFLMCTFCHAKHVANTPLASAFASPTRYKGTCRFGASLRISKVLLPKQDLSALTDYVALRSGLPLCPGGNGKQEAGTEYWTSSEFKDLFSVCHGCYHDWLGATPWQNRFSKQTGGQWYCDGAMPVQQRGLSRYGSHGDWAGFIGYTNRYPILACEGKPVPASSTRWYTPRRTIEGMVICHGCFNSMFAATPFEHEMIPYTLPTNGNDFTCDMHHATLANAMVMAVYMTGNFNTFWNTAAAHLATLTKQLPKTFYTLSGPPSNFDVCETCLLGYVAPLGMQGFFVQQPNAAASCDMCPDAPRRRAFHLRMLDAYWQTNFRPFGAFARKIAQYPACPRRDTRKNGTWYTFGPTCNVCPECWINWASITPLGRATNVQPIQKSESIICCLWSERMRNLWRAGDLADFKTFAAHREQVYINTWLKFKMDLEMNTIKAAQAANMGVNGIIMAGSYATAGATQYGNNSIGWYNSSTQASGQQMIKQSNQMWSEVAQGNTGHAQLIQLWTTVE